MQKALIIQTAFIGDVILATSLIEDLKKQYPDLQLDFLLRKGNENIIEDNPHIDRIIIWDKKNKKFNNLIKIISLVRRSKYDLVINLQRFLSTGFITLLSNGKTRLGFNKNPLSIFFTKRFPHEIGNGDHEIHRNHLLISDLTGGHASKPKIYPSEADKDRIKKYQSAPYITISPSSVWFTKQFPKSKWIEFLDLIQDDFSIYLLGSKDDYDLCDEIVVRSVNLNLINLAGKLSLKQSAALMIDSKMNYVNDSAPLHLASATNSPVSAIFCSTISDFGFGPLSDRAFVVESNEKLDCRPCGLHGKKYCPINNFKCGLNIDLNDLLNTLGESQE